MKILGLVIFFFILGYAVHYILGIMVFFAGLFIIMGTLDLSSGKKSKGRKTRSKKSKDMSPRIKFEFYILDTDKEIPVNKWFQKKTSKNEGSPRQATGYRAYSSKCNAASRGELDPKFD